MQTSAVEEKETEIPANDEITLVPISKIIVADRVREGITEVRVGVLAESIKSVGLLQPIVLTKDFRLVAGKHRLQACEKNGWEEIPAIIKTYNTVDAELAEIDENLCRFDLTEMERGIHVNRRSKLYEIKFPQTIRGKRKEELKKKWEEAGKPTDDPNIPNFDFEPTDEKPVPFVKDTATKSGRSTSQIRDEVHLGEALMDRLTPEIRALIAPTGSADNKSDLKLLVNESDEDIQLEAAQMVRDSFDDDTIPTSKKLKIADALRQLNPNRSFEATSTETGETSLLKSLQKTTALLEAAINNPKFEETAKTWTNEGIADIQADFEKIEELAGIGVSVLSEILDSRK